VINPFAFVTRLFALSTVVSMLPIAPFAWSRRVLKKKVSEEPSFISEAFSGCWMSFFEPHVGGCAA
jgi:hypothetical protein